jgi:hypothetical protein
MSLAVHDKTLRLKATATLAGCTKKIVTTYQMATAEQIELGAQWYTTAGLVVDEVAELGNISRDTAAVVLAHLSPQTPWGRNVAGARQLVVERQAHACMGPNISRALTALDAEDPWSTFGRRAHKTRRFARNLLGYTDVVTVDVWAMRVAFGKGWGPNWRTGDDDGLEVTLRRPGVYEAVEYAYQRAGRRLGVRAIDAQATAWIVARNGRAN